MSLRALVLVDAGTAAIAIPTPTALFTRVCIQAAGDVQCPNSDYPNRFVSYRSLSDNRVCTPCVAVPKGGVGCAPLTAFSSEMRAGSGTSLVVDASCDQVDNVVSVSSTAASRNRQPESRQRRDVFLD